MDTNVLRDKIRAKIAEKTAPRGKELLAKIRANRANLTPEEIAERQRAYSASRAGKRDAARRQARQQRRGQRAWTQSQRDAAQRQITAQNMARAAAGEIGTLAMQANVRRRLENEARLQGKVISNG